MTTGRSGAHILGCVLVMGWGTMVNSAAQPPDTTRIGMTYGQASLTFEQFDPSPLGDEGGIGWWYLPLPEGFQPPFRWTFSFTIPDSSESCEDPDCRLARVGFVLLGGNSPTSLGGQDPAADYIVFDFDACHGSMSLCHYQYPNVYHNLIGDSLAAGQRTGSHHVQIDRDETGVWRLILDGVLIGSGQHSTLPPSLGTFDVISVYCSGVSVRLHEPFYGPVPASAQPSDRHDKPAAVNAARPNPTAGGTHVRFEARGTGPVELRIVDMNGRLVRRVVNWVSHTGRNEVYWDGRDAVNRPVATGTYYFDLRHDGIEEAGRIIFLQ